MTAKRPKFRVKILWGQEHEPGDHALSYEFDSERELDAFLYGVDEAVGWLDCEITDPRDKKEED